MKRRKIIELLNLYIDGEIDVDDQERLEKEISENPEARQLYHQYCRLDDATRLVYRQFRLQAPPESLTDRAETTPFLSPMGRLRRFTLVAGGVAAAIAVVSGGLVVFGPSMPENDTEAIAVTSGGSSPGRGFVALTPTIQPFGSVSAPYELQSAAFGPQVPADWTPGIEIPVPAQSLDTAPQAWPAYGGIRWNAPQRIGSGLSLSGFDTSRVYRGPERGESEDTRPVSFQFRK